MLCIQAPNINRSGYLVLWHRSGRLTLDLWVNTAHTVYRVFLSSLPWTTALPKCGVAPSLTAKIGCPLRSALSKKVPVTNKEWIQTTIPLKLGGLGLRDYEDAGTAARLAGLVKDAEFSLELGVDP